MASLALEEIAKQVPRWKPLPNCKEHYVLRKISCKWKFRRLPPPPIRRRIGGGSLFIRNLMRNWSWQKFLHWKLLENISISGLEKNWQTKSHTCDLKKFSVRIFPIFEHFWNDLNICRCECTRFPIAYLTELYVAAVSPIKILETNQEMRDEL